MSWIRRGLAILALCGVVGATSASEGNMKCLDSLFYLNPTKIAKPESLLFVGHGIYSKEYPIPVIMLAYDEDGDGREDKRFLYLATPVTKSITETVLLEYREDRNHNGTFEDDEITRIIDLREFFSATEETSDSS